MRVIELHETDETASRISSCPLDMEEEHEQMIAEHEKFMNTIAYI